MGKLTQEQKDKAYERYGRVCMCCGKTEEEGIDLNVDHIYPVSIYKYRGHVSKNLQILCGKCNRAKSNIFIKDYRYEPRNYDRFPEETKRYLNKIKSEMKSWKESLSSEIGTNVSARQRKLEKRKKKRFEQEQLRKSQLPADCGQIVKPSWLQ